MPELPEVETIAADLRPHLIGLSIVRCDLRFPTIVRHPEPETFVELTYINPSGGTKACRNSQLAGCELTLADRRAGTRETLTAGHRALIETLR